MTISELTDLRTTQPALGCSIHLPSIMAADVIARCGFDFALIDQEHGPASDETALGQLAALASRGVPAVIRPAQAANPWVTRALDLGAVGVLAPNITSPEMAEQLVRSATYGADQGRGVATGVIRASDYGVDLDYEGRWNSQRLIIAQIESRRGVDAAKEIASVEGVDALFFGPADFAASAGYPGGAEVSAAFDAVVEAAASAGKRSGGAPFAGVDAVELLVRGANFNIIASDVALLRNAAQSTVDTIRAQI